MADPVLPADEVAEIRKWTVWNGYVDAGRLADSHESLRATVAYLRGAAGDLQEGLDGVASGEWGIDDIKPERAALRAALDDTSEQATDG